MSNDRLLEETYVNKICLSFELFYSFTPFLVGLPQIFGYFPLKKAKILGKSKKGGETMKIFKKRGLVNTSRI